MVLLAAFVFLLFCYSLVSRRLEGTIVTAPIVFAAAGMLVGLSRPQCSARPSAATPSFAWPKSAWCCCSSPMPAAPT